MIMSEELNSKNMLIHDCKNQHNLILNCAELLLIKLEQDDSSLVKYCNTIIRSTKISSTLIKEIVDDKKEKKNKKLEIKKVIKQSISSFNNNLDMEVIIKLNSNCENDFFVGDSFKIENAILNLLINAKDAMKDNTEDSVLSISVVNETVDISDRLYLIEGVDKGDYIKIEISDTGKGISKEERDLMFNVGYSTKDDQNELCGIGLASVKKTIYEHSGYIFADSNIMGKGATITVLLPLLNDTKN